MKERPRVTRALRAKTDLDVRRDLQLDTGSRKDNLKEAKTDG